MTNVFADYVGRYPEMHFARGNSRDGSARTAIDANGESLRNDLLIVFSSRALCVHY